MKFKKGDKIEIIDRGALYSTFKEMAKKMELKHNIFGDNGVSNGNVGKIVSKGYNHEALHRSTIIYGVRINRKDFIMGEEGLKLVKPNKPIKPSKTLMMFSVEELEACLEYRKDVEAKKIKINAYVKERNKINAELKRLRG